MSHIKEIVGFIVMGVALGLLIGGVQKDVPWAWFIGFVLFAFALSSIIDAKIQQHKEEDN
jgi:hypothetical protein